MIVRYLIKSHKRCMEKMESCSFKVTSGFIVDELQLMK
nr:MAG TPA: hypothetical protein [Caudoviricetes sp.]